MSGSAAVSSKNGRSEKKEKGVEGPATTNRAGSPRLKRLQKSLKKRKLDAFIVTHIPDIRYLSGFTGSAGTLLVTRKKAWLLTDGRYATQVAGEVYDGVEPIIERGHLEYIRKEKLVKKGMDVGFQAAWTTVSFHEAMKGAFRKSVKLVAAGDLVRDLSAIKTEGDIASIRKAANIAAKVYREILEIAEPGMRELDLAAEISYRGRLHGSEGDAFDIIVASGERSALPHGRASAKKIAKGDMVTLDFGCIVDGFNSDMTRTFAVGEPGPEAREVYRIVHDAERAGVAAARAGMAARDLDKVCRDIIDEAGYGPNFSHSTGHGLGLEVHEYPPVATRSPEGLKLEVGMVVTIEPGIYLPGKFGVRIEDDVVIEEGGCRELTSPTRQLIIV